MLVAVFLAGLIWNLSTWYLGIPCSSSHAILGSLLGVSIVSAFMTSRSVSQGVDWSQVWSVLKALLFSPLLGFIGAGLLFRLLQWTIHDRHLYEVTTEDRPPVWWVRMLLVLTCSGVTFSHGSNDGQKSIGLIMLTIIGIRRRGNHGGIRRGRSAWRHLADHHRLGADAAGDDCAGWRSVPDLGRLIT